MEDSRKKTTNENNPFDSFDRNQIDHACKTVSSIDDGDRNSSFDHG
jgi:hypothetical protein